MQTNPKSRWSDQNRLSDLDISFDVDHYFQQISLNRLSEPDMWSYPANRKLDAET